MLMSRQSFRRDSSRRSFLRLGSAASLGWALSPSMHAQADQNANLSVDASSNVAGQQRANARNIILVWLSGGPSTIDMWDPKPDAPASIRGEFSTIATSVSGVRFCEHLPKLAAVMDRCTLIRSVSHSIPAHGPGARYMLTGHLPSASTQHPALGAIVSREWGNQSSIPQNSVPPSSIPRYVSINPADPFGSDEAGFLDSSANPFRLDQGSGEIPVGVSLGRNADRESFARRLKLRDQFDRSFDRLSAGPMLDSLTALNEQSREILRKDSIFSAIDLSKEDEQVAKLYGQNSDLGRNMLRACRLVQAGSRFVTVGYPGWDTHNDNFSQLRNRLLPNLDRALSGLILDLQQRGLLESTIVMCCGEFARTPEINATAGRDHWSSASSALLAGGGFREGLVYGATDDSGASVTEGKVSPADLASSVLLRLGIDPMAKIATPAGREIRINSLGTPIKALVG